MAAIVVAGLAAEAAPAADRRLSLDLEAGSAWYRYEESGRREFAGLETEWAEVAFRVAAEARYRTPFDVVSLLRFSFLTSLEETETNNVGASSTDLRVPYFFNLQPGLQKELPIHPALTLAPEVSWDLDWYLQVRELQDGGQVDESVFWHGPAAGFQAWLALGEAWTVELTYRHSFLIDVRASNSFAEDLGFGTLTTDGQRDVAGIGLIRRLSERCAVRVGYRFESARIEASDTALRTVDGPDGPQTFRVQFPENDHTLHGGTISFETLF